MDAIGTFLAQYGAWLFLISLLTIVGAAIAVPWLVAMLPPDYFRSRRRHRQFGRSGRHPALAWLLAVVKNTLGVTLLLLGFVMLFTPGQGLLTLLAGVFLLDFPGKFAVERRIVAAPGVLRMLNWIRSRRGCPPLQPPATGGSRRAGDRRRPAAGALKATAPQSCRRRE